MWLLTGLVSVALAAALTLRPDVGAPSLTDARTQLQLAHEMLDAMGMAAFAERARRELPATGAKVRKRNIDAREQLTPQEEQIARLARDGLTNPEIAATLFLSARTVEWHLRNIFTKLGISSRRELRTALPKGAQEPTPGGHREDIPAERIDQLGVEVQRAAFAVARRAF